MNKKLGLRIQQPDISQEGAAEPIIADEALMNPRPDPNFDSINEYVYFYVTEMQLVSEKRVQYLNESDARKVAEQHRLLNRYSNITPILKTQPSQEYFNGNLITLGRFNFLITQAPTQIDSFYRTVARFKPLQIAQLTKFAEDNIPKAERYIPLAEGESLKFYQESVSSQYTSMAFAQALQESNTNRVFLSQELINRQRQHSPDSFVWHHSEIVLEDENLRVKCVGFDDIDEDIYKARVQMEQIKPDPVEFQQSQVSAKQQFDYIYYGKWCDFQKPGTEQEIFKLCALQLDSIARDNENIKMVLHCSAGIGRSATYAICIYIYDSFYRHELQPGDESWKRLPTSIYNAVESIRTSRHPMCVQTVDQFRFLFSFAEYCHRQFPDEEVTK